MIENNPLKMINAILYKKPEEITDVKLEKVKNIRKYHLMLEV